MLIERGHSRGDSSVPVGDVFSGVLSVDRMRAQESAQDASLRFTYFCERLFEHSSNAQQTPFGVILLVL